MVEEMSPNYIYHIIIYLSSLPPALLTFLLIYVLLVWLFGQNNELFENEIVYRKTPAPRGCSGEKRG